MAKVIWSMHLKNFLMLALNEEWLGLDKVQFYSYFESF